MHNRMGVGRSWRCGRMGIRYSGQHLVPSCLEAEPAGIQRDQGSRRMGQLRASLLLARNPCLQLQYYATAETEKVTKKSGSAPAVRNLFLQQGKLDDCEDREFRAINDRWPVFGFAIDLGYVKNYSRVQPPPTVFTIGLCQIEAIQYLGDGITVLPSL